MGHRVRPEQRRDALGAGEVLELRAALDAFRCIVQALREKRGNGRGSPLSSAQRFALQRIAEHPEASVNEIAALTFTHQSSVSVVIQRLVERGLVGKVAARDDRRRQRLVVTAKGKRALGSSPTAAQEHLIDAIGTLKAEDRRSLARTLNRVALAMRPDGLPSYPPMFFEDARTTNGKPKGKARRA